MTTAISIEDVRREVKILKALSGHKNLVKYHDACEDTNNVYIVMEYVSCNFLHESFYRYIIVDDSEQTLRIDLALFFVFYSDSLIILSVMRKYPLLGLQIFSASINYVASCTCQKPSSALKTNFNLSLSQLYLSMLVALIELTNNQRV